METIQITQADRIGDRMDYFDRHYCLFSGFNVELESPWGLAQLVERRMDMGEKL